MRKAMPEGKAKFAPHANPAFADEVTRNDRAGVAPRLDSLLQQLTAMRLDLMHGIIPRAERIGLTKDDLEYVLRQLDDAIAVGQDIAACLRQSVDAATTPGAWRSEDTPAKVREVS